MNTVWWKKLEGAVEGAIPKIEQVAKSVAVHMDRAVETASSTWEKEKIPEKMKATWETAKKEWAEKSASETKPPAPKP